MSPTTSISDSNHPDIFQIRCHYGDCQEPVCIPSKGSHDYPLLCLSHHTIFVSKDMPHADASLIPSRYVVIIDHRILSHQQDEALKVNQNSGHMSIHSWRVLSGKRETGWLFLHSRSILLAHGWYEITNCANASSLIYNSLLAFPAYFGTASDNAVNWCGMLLRNIP